MSLSSGVWVTAARSPLVVWPEVRDPVVSAIVVTHGPTPTLLATLASLGRHHRGVVLSTEVIVVVHPDDAGADARGWLEESTAGIVMVAPGENRGFGGGNALGAEIARGEFLALVNPDLVVTEGWLDPLVAAFEDPAVAIAAPVLLHADGRIQEAGQVVFADGGTDPIGGPRMFTDDRSVMFDRDVDYASAACWVMRRDLFGALGGFDPAYHPAYFEDVDLALRAEAEGYVTRLITQRPVVHDHATTAPSDATRSLARRSRQIFEQRWAEVLPGHVERPLDAEVSEALALEARDRRCRHRRLVVVAENTSHEIDERLAEVQEWARRRPRDRIAVVVDPATCDARARESWYRRLAPAGAELVIADPLDVIDRRGSWCTEVDLDGEEMTPRVARERIAARTRPDRYPAR